MQIIVAMILIILSVLGGMGSTNAASMEETAALQTGFDGLEAAVRDESAPVDWRLACAIIRRTGSSRDALAASGKDAEALLVEILRRRAPVRLTANTPPPGVQPPLAMLQTAAIDALVRMGSAGNHLAEIQTLRDETPYIVLRGTAEGALVACGAGTAP